MKQLGLALSMYCDNNGGRFPLSTHGITWQNLGKTWIFTLAPYVEKVDKIRICPNDPFGEERLANQGTSYVLNEYIVVAANVNDPDADQALRMQDIRTTHRMITVFIVSDGAAASTFSDHVHSRHWFTGTTGEERWEHILEDIQVDRFSGVRGSDPADGHTGGYSNYLFADGHVDTLPASLIRKWADSNYNFARPNPPTLPPE